MRWRPIEWNSVLEEITLRSSALLYPYSIGLNTLLSQSLSIHGFLECILFASPIVCCSATESAQMPRMAHLQWIQVSPLLTYKPASQLTVQSWVYSSKNSLFLITESSSVTHKKTMSFLMKFYQLDSNSLVGVSSNRVLLCLFQQTLMWAKGVIHWFSVSWITSGGNQKGTLPWLLLDGTNRAMTIASQYTNI